MMNMESSLPPGFRFHPTDEELILHYLRNKAASTPCPVSIIAEVDIYKFNPWDLPAKATFGEREWYFFSPRDRKYPNGDRPNRAAACGYWKATGTDKQIVVGREGKKNIGVKKALVFYKGRAPKGVKTNWIMHEYRLAEAISNNNRRIKSNDRPMRLDEWVLCRIYKKSNSPPTMVTMAREKEDPLIENPTLASLPNILHQPSSYLLPPAHFPLLIDNKHQLGPVFTNPNLNNDNYSYALPKLPEQVPSTVGNSDPSKKFNDSYTFSTINNQLDTSQYQLLNHAFYNQQYIPLSSYIEFQ